MYQSIKYSIVIFIFSVIFCATMYSQENSILGEYPCGSDDGVSTYNVAATATSKQSSTNDVHDSSNAIDGNYSDASLAETNNDGNAWLEIELDKPTNVKELKIWYPSDKPLGKFYVLLSSLPFESGNLANELVSPNNEYLYVEALSSGSAIPIDRSGVKFIRIQNETAGPLSLLEVEVPGVSEICDNGKDDDCDGLVDCEDPDCSPSIYNVNYAHPTCPICFDGEIQIRASGENLKYSIDGGANFYSCNPIPNSQHCGFFNLGEGEYNIVVANEQCTTTYIGNPVILFPPEGTPRGSCFNGGFEEGTFEGWTGGIGLVSGNFFGDETIDPPGSGQTSKHQIISSSGDFDPYAGADIPLASPDGSAYFVRLGNAEEELRSQRLTYCLTAADDNRAFSFYYALVMEDGDRPDYAHAASQQPYFQWNILDGDGNVKREGEPIKADVDNPFFIVNEERFLVWLGWTKECFDLYEYVDEGEEICIEFITADCSVSANGHFSYAYIDGLCSDGVAPSPPALELNDAYCENQTVSVSAVGGNGYNQYDWTVCRYIDGIPLQCFITETTPGYSNPTLDNVLDFFFKDRPPSVKPLECGDKFKVTLTVRDDCLGSTSVSKDFTYICEQNEIDYLDIIVCSGLQDLPITGINDCNDCSVEWTPGQYLDDPSIPFPTILGSLNTLAFDQIYHVEVTNDFGCVYEDEIEIFEKSEIYGELTLEVNSLNFCEEEIIAHIQFDQPIFYGDVSVVFEVTGDNPHYYPPNEPITGEGELYYTTTTYEGELILTNDPPVFDMWSFKIPEVMLRRFDYNIRVIVSMGAIPINGEVYGNCALTKIFDVPAGPYHGWMTVEIPNVFSPNSPNPENQTLGPYFNGNSNVIAITFDVWDRWGGFAFDGEAITSSLEGPGLTGYEPGIRWDGTIDGQPANSGTYVWVLDYGNCDYVLLDCADCDIWDIDDGGCGDCSNEERYGSSDLIY